MLRGFRALLLALTVVMILPGLASAQTLPRAATDPVNVEITVPLQSADDPDGYGAITVTAVGTSKAVCYAMAVARITLPAQGATLFAGSSGGNNVLVARLKAPDRTGTASGCVAAAPALLTGLDTDPGGYYVEIATAAQPRGAIRGRLVQPRAEPRVARPRPADSVAPSATATPAPTNPATATPGTGTDLAPSGFGSQRYGSGSEWPSTGGSGSGTSRLPAGTFPPAGSGPAQPVAPGTTGAHGFGAGAGAGTDASQCMVTSLGDSGAGTLRDCAERPGATSVRFSAAGTISLSSPVRVTSDKNLDGGGRVALAGNGLQIADASNVVVRGFSFEQGAGDSIGLLGAFDQVWIDHNTFSTTADGSIDVTLTNNAPGYHQATVSWNHFRGTDKTMLVNPNPALDVNTHDDRLRLTIDHNFFDGTVQRNPLVHQAKVDFYNNYLSNWSAYGGNSYSQAQTWAEGNIYEAGADKQAMNTGGNGPHSPGYAANVNNWLVNGAQFEENYPQGVFNPSSFYQRRVDQPSEQLAYALATQTGSRNSSATTPTLPGIAPTTTAPAGATAPLAPTTAGSSYRSTTTADQGSAVTGGGSSSDATDKRRRIRVRESIPAPTETRVPETRVPEMRAPERVAETTPPKVVPTAEGRGADSSAAADARVSSSSTSQDTPGAIPQASVTRATAPSAFAGSGLSRATPVATATAAGQPLPVAVGEPSGMPAGTVPSTAVVTQSEVPVESVEIPTTLP